MQIAATGRALPPHRYTQTELAQAFATVWGERHHNVDRVLQLHDAVQVQARHLALPMEAYAALDFGSANKAWIDVATDLGAEAVQSALTRAGLTPSDVDAIWFTTVTGIAAPSIDARIANRIGLRGDVRRTPMFGLGCVAGAAGIARMYDVLRAEPDSVAVLLSVELCSLTLQRGDVSVANLIASGLFGDGAAAVVAVGEHRARTVSCAGPRVVARRSAFYPDTEHVMGWDVGNGGFRIVLSAEVPTMARTHIASDVDGFLHDHDLTRADIATWVCHPGGPKVLQAFEEALELSADDLAVTRRSLREVGNLSSSSVLLVLDDIIAAHRPAPGAWGVMLAMGPGFCSELVLLQW